jgi:hypothetical protein
MDGTGGFSHFVAPGGARGYSVAAALSIYTKRRTTMTVQTGAPAPDFTLGSHADQKVSLSTYRGRPVVVTFMPFAFTGG